MAFVIGLTGGIGSGKTTVANRFAALGVELVDADLIAREIVEPGEPALAQIFEHFGDELKQADESLDRSALRRIVFQNPEQRQWLESLLHPLIRQRTIEKITAAQPPYVILVSPLLLETDQHQLVDHVLVVDLPVETQISRTMARDGNDEPQVRAIIASQMARNERLAQADSVLDNSADPATLDRQITELDARFRSLATEHGR